MTLPTTTRSRRAPLEPGAPGFIGATSHDTLRVPARSTERRRRRAPLGWLPWAALAALLGLLLLVVLAATLVGSDDSTSSSSAPQSAPARAGSLTAGGGDLLAGGDSLGRLPDLNGASVVGRDVLVQSVVADEGFWVGRSAADRVFVYLTPQARQAEGESPFQVRAGQRVDLAGTVGLLGPNGAQRLGVADVEGARQLTAQKGYVVAKTVHLSS
ncbi:MAG: hypothetical protein QOE05_3495 [Actinomycetota bacterium]|nr:hypothetical protein [Actinomycetota bacterium]